MYANERTLHDIFDPSIRLVAPLFQRPYVWGQERNWQPLWESVYDITERRLQGLPVRPHFLGAIVLDQVSSPTGAISTREIIDGQQRLTTLQILLAAVRDLCGQFQQPNYQKAFAKWTENDIPLSDEPNDSFKIWPTNVDREDFKRVMTAGNPFAIYHAYAPAQGADAIYGTLSGFGVNDDPAVQHYLLRRAGRSTDERHRAYGQLSKAQQKQADSYIRGFNSIQHRIPNAYLYFYALLLDWLPESGDETFLHHLKALYQTLKDDLVLVVIDLGAKDDAQQIFETMNALGTPLLPADLVKNFLFRSAEQEQAPIDQLYSQIWSVFDREKEWRQDVRQGRLKRPKIDLFLQHYLTRVTGEEVMVTNLFNAYRTWVKTRPGISAADQLKQFRRYADIYHRFDHFPPGSREALFFNRLNLMDTTTVYPVLLEVFATHGASGNGDEIRQILIDLESFLVRRMICGLSSKGYNHLFQRDLMRYLLDTEDFSAATIRSFFIKQDADARRWPNDEEFLTAWLEKPLYTLLVQRRLHMILEALDRQLHTQRTETYSFTGKLTIEHLLPQAWTQHWPIENIEDSELATLRRNQVLHTIGNLTLLTKALNPSVSNGPWTEKRARILAHSAINLNRALPETWDEASILQRSNDLFKEAIKIWPYPASG